MTSRWFLLILIGLLACTSENPTSPLPTDPPITATVQSAISNLQSSAANEPTQTPDPPTPTPIAEPATPTPAAIQPSTTPIPTATTTTAPTATPHPTETPLPTETATPIDEFACRPLDQLLDVPASYTAVFPPYARPSAWPDPVYSGIGGEFNLIHLGFDVEGNTSQLNALLDMLDRRQVKATMYMVGSWIESNPGWLETFIQRGHEVANHTYSHGNMRQMTPEQITDELEITETLILNTTGRTSKPWLRPPFGSRSDESIQVAYDLGWTTVIWSGSTNDWEEDTNADKMCRTMMETAVPGAIYYSHTFHPEIVEAIDRFIGEIQDQGYTFVPLSVMMAPDPSIYLIEAE